MSISRQTVARRHFSPRFSSAVKATQSERDELRSSNDSYSSLESLGSGAIYNSREKKKRKKYNSAQKSKYARARGDKFAVVREFYFAI